jgi:hypothetical protein
LSKYLPIHIDDLHLTVKDQKFVAEYCSNGYDASKAIVSAGILPSATSSVRLRAHGHEILSRQEINTAIDRMTENFLTPYRDRMISQMVARLQVRAGYDVDWFYHPDGTAKPLDQITAEQRWAIDDIEIKHFGKDGDITETKYKLADQDAARKELKAMLDRKEAGKEDNNEMRGKLADIFAALKTGVDYGMQIEKKKEKEKAEDALLDAPEQKTTILPEPLSPSEIRRRINRGEMSPIKRG